MSKEGGREVKGKDSADGEVFQALSHRVRRAIIRALAEKGERSFTELMEDVGLKDSSVMAFHMRKLSTLIRRNERGYYELTGLGWRAYNVLRELEIESLKDRAEEVIKGISGGRERVEVGGTESTTGSGEALTLIGSIVSRVIKAVTNAIGNLTPAEALKEVLGEGKVRVERKAPPAPKVRINVLGSDVALSTSKEGILLKGCARRGADASIRSSEGEAVISVKGFSGEVGIPEINSLELTVKGGSVSIKNLNLPSNTKLSVIGGDLSAEACVKKLKNIAVSVKGGDALANLTVNEVEENSTAELMVMGGDAQITLQVPSGTKVVKKSTLILGGDAAISIDESLKEGKELAISVKVVGGDATLIVKPVMKK